MTAPAPRTLSLMDEREDGELGILARRRIEAAIIAPIYDEMRQAIGEEKARDILRRAIRRAAIEAGAEMASRAPGEADLESFKAILPLWTKDDALTIEVLVDAPGVLDFNVKRCRYAETYRAMGLGDIGDILSCNRDGAFCEGYDPRIKLTRTQTIMGGASHCDFRYRAGPPGQTLTRMRRPRVRSGARSTARWGTTLHVRLSPVAPARRERCAHVCF